MRVSAATYNICRRSLARTLLKDGMFLKVGVSVPVRAREADPDRLVGGLTNNLLPWSLGLRFMARKPTSEMTAAYLLSTKCRISPSIGWQCAFICYIRTFWRPCFFITYGHRLDNREMVLECAVDQYVSNIITAFF